MIPDQDLSTNIVSNIAENAGLFWPYNKAYIRNGGPPPSTPVSNKRCFHTREHSKVNSDTMTMQTDPFLAKIINEVCSDIEEDSWATLNSPRNEGIPEAVERIKTVLNYNLEGARHIRKLIVEEAYQCLAENPTKSMEQASVLGWCVELIQTVFLMLDDVMDKGTLRRNKPAWYTLQHVGDIALNDCMLMYTLVFQLVRRYCKDLPMYVDLLTALQKAGYFMTLGQCVDTLSGKDKDFEVFSTNKAHYHTIANYKTSYFSAYLPIKLGMLLAGISLSDPGNKELWRKVKQVSQGIGKHFQLQDDMFDVYEETSKKDKTTNDIEEGKCTWLFVTAQELCSPEEYEVLRSNYGFADKRKVDIVEELYLKLDIPGQCISYWNNLYEEAGKINEQIENERLKKYLYTLLDKAHKGVFACTKKMLAKNGGEKLELD